MSHYIADLAVFGHVMGADTNWGDEVHHSDYEDYVKEKTSSYSADFNAYLSYDGRLDNVSAYNAALQLAYNTTFGVNGSLTCVWMDSNYNWSNPVFKNRAGQSLNLAINYLTEVLHMLYSDATQQSSNTTQQSATSRILINEVEQNPTGTDAGNEWVELYNPTSNTVDIGSWTLSTTAGVTVTLTIPSGTTISAGGYSVITYGSQWLDNEDESIILGDADGNEIDRTPILSDTYNDERSWQRYPDGQDTNSTNDWSFRTSTMESSNGGSVTKSPSSISISVSPTSLTIGTTLTVSGSISPACSGATVTLSYTLPNGTIISRYAVSGSDGRYDEIYTPLVLGAWSVKASWEGDSTYLGATSSSRSFTISKASSTISCTVPFSNVNIGSNLTISGSINPVRPGVTVVINYYRDGQWSTLTMVTSSSTGGYSYIWTPALAGSYQLKASWAGDDTYDGATSSIVSVSVNAPDTTAPIISSITPANGSTLSSSTLTISASYYDNIAVDTISITLNIDGIVVTPTSLTGTRVEYYGTFTEGAYMVSLTVRDTSGNVATATWSFIISLPKQDITKPVISAIAPSNGSTITEKSVTISAQYSDNVAVNLGSVMLKVDGNDVTSSSTVTATSISYSATLEEGNHSINLAVSDTSGNTATATWSFSIEQQPPPSTTGSRCVIATATYGSELAPQVQFLREFRETIVLKTFAGSSFMTVFNAWYYSWSPPVAASIAPDPTIKAVMRVILQPLLDILQVAASTFSLFGFNPEIGIVVAGLVASALIGLVYFMPLTALAVIGLSRWRGATPKVSWIRILVAPWLASLALMFMAELLATPSLMMVASGAFVILTIAVVSASIALKVANLVNPKFSNSV